MLPLLKRKWPHLHHLFATMTVETTSVNVTPAPVPTPPPVPITPPASSPAPEDDTDFAQDAAELLGVTSSGSRSAQIAAVMEASNTGESAANSPDAWNKTEKSTNASIQHARKASPE